MAEHGLHWLPSRTWRPWRALRVALVGAWCVWVVLAWWSAPRPADVERARADIAAGKVAVYEWGESWERPTVSSWGSMPLLRSSGDDGAVFVWRNPDGRTRYAVMGDGYAQSDQVFFDDEDHRSSPAAEAIRAAVRSSVLATGGPNAGDLLFAAPYVATVIGLVCLAILAAGPAPVIGTRWYWFWIGTFVPFGLGTLAWLVLERPWSGRAAAPSEPSVEKRKRGYIGFLVAVGAAIVVGLLADLVPGGFGIG